MMRLEEARALVERALNQQAFYALIKKKLGWRAMDQYSRAMEDATARDRDAINDLLNVTDYPDQDTYRFSAEANGLTAVAGKRPGTYHVVNHVEASEELYHWEGNSWREVEYLATSPAFRSRYSPEEDPRAFWSDAAAYLTKNVGNLSGSRWGTGGEWELEEIAVTSEGGYGHEDDEDDEDGERWY